VLHGIAGDPLMPDADFIDAEHDAPYLRNRRLGESLLRVQRLEPALYAERFHVIGNLFTPAGDEIVPDIMLDDGYRVNRLRAYRVCPKISLQVMFGKNVEPGATGAGGVAVDASRQPQPIHFAPRILLFREVTHEADRESLLYPPAFRVHYPEAQHPGCSFLAQNFLQ
jgi:hypothetical protein